MCKYITSIATTLFINCNKCIPFFNITVRLKNYLKMYHKIFLIYYNFCDFYSIYIQTLTIQNTSIFLFLLIQSISFQSIIISLPRTSIARF